MPHPPAQRYASYGAHNSCPQYQVCGTGIAEVCQAEIRNLSNSLVIRDHSQRGKVSDDQRMMA